MAETQSVSLVAAKDHGRNKIYSNKGSAVREHPPATSVLLQGNPKTAERVLFLFPDGSGSAAPFASLGRVSPNIAIVGLNCPYVKNPADLKGTLSDLTPVYLKEIQKRQPKGPYSLGGWSAGGICALDAAQELDRRGESVHRLILIDSPCPVALGKLPPRLFDFLEKIGIFAKGGRPPPDWLFPHFKAFIRTLEKYKAKPCIPYREPSTRIIWAEDGVCSSAGSPMLEMTDNDPPDMKWLLCKRTDLSAQGWERLLNPQTVSIETMADANHFTMMKPENGAKLASFVQRAMQ